MSQVSSSGSAEGSVRDRGVIWITGYSAAGKTTVGRLVERQLKAAGVSTVFLDGDDLRSILGDKWGYSRDERIELARVYFRLCSHLAAQGLTVVISAVAMYDEVRNWVKANVPNTLEAYLHVPDAERRRRDAATKKVYAKLGNLTDLYDEPLAPDLKIENHGDLSPEDVAQQIVEHFFASADEVADVGRTAHWRSFYRSDIAPIRPSPFAESVADKLDEPVRMVEVGCGNGRDAGFFATIGHDVTALDLSEAAIEFCREQHADKSIRFEAGGLSDVAGRLDGPYDVVYSRFVLHAMPLEEEIATLHAAGSLLKPGGRLFVECRSINDPMARLGEVISPTERIHGHYRRFIIAEELVERVRAAGLEVEDLVEADGLAVYKDDNPVVIRLSARKR